MSDDDTEYTYEPVQRPNSGQYWTAEEMAALNQVLAEKDARIAALEAQLAEAQQWEPVKVFQTKWRGTTLTFSFWDKGTSPVIITESDTTHIVLLPEDHCLCRRVAKPQPPQPDWSTAPKEAIWWFVDGDGEEWFSEVEPTEINRWTCTWDVSGSVCETEKSIFIDIPLGIDWRLLKQRRP